MGHGPSKASRHESFLSTLAIPEFGSALNQFPDVPTNHWAAKAILDLRKHDLLHGYPEGSFNGRVR